MAVVVVVVAVVVVVFRCVRVARVSIAPRAFNRPPPTHGHRLRDRLPVLDRAALAGLLPDSRRAPGMAGWHGRGGDPPQHFGAVLHGPAELRSCVGRVQLGHQCPGLQR